jgi:hypothetical protein
MTRMVTSTAPAAMAPCGTVNRETPGKMEIAAGTVCAADSLARGDCERPFGDRLALAG